MNDYTRDELNVTFDFLRERTDHKPNDRVPLHVFIKVLWGWSNRQGYDVRPDREAVAALLTKAGYHVAPGVNFPVVWGLRLKPRGR